MKFKIQLFDKEKITTKKIVYWDGFEMYGRKFVVHKYIDENSEPVLHRFSVSDFKTGIGVSNNTPSTTKEKAIEVSREILKEVGEETFNELIKEYKEINNAVKL